MLILGHLDNNFPKNFMFGAKSRISKVPVKLSSAIGVIETASGVILKRILTLENLFKSDCSLQYDSLPINSMFTANPEF